MVRKILLEYNERCYRSALLFGSIFHEVCYQKLIEVISKVKTHPGAVVGCARPPCSGLCTTCPAGEYDEYR